MCLLQNYPTKTIQQENIMSLTAKCLLTDCMNRHSDIISKAELAVDMRSKWNRSRMSSNNHKRRNRKSDDCPSKGRKKEDEAKSTSDSSHQANNDENLVNGGDVVDACLPLSSRLPTVFDLPKTKTSIAPKKVVHFNDDVQVVEFPYTQDEKDVRKKYWENFVIDRSRFKERIAQVEEALSPILSPEHRERINRERWPPSSSLSSTDPQD